MRFARPAVAAYVQAKPKHRLSTTQTRFGYGTVLLLRGFGPTPNLNEDRIMAANRKGPSRRSANQEQQGQQDTFSATELLKEDHREVQAFFEEYENVEGDAEKETLALKICLALQVHAQIEEEIFYPEVRKAISKPELIDEAIVEHAAAKQLIAEIEAMEVGDSMGDAKVKVLGEQITHHVEEEEGELFPAVEAAGLDVNALGQRMSARKAELLKQLAEEGEIR